MVRGGVGRMVKGAGGRGQGRRVGAALELPRAQPRACPPPTTPHTHTHRPPARSRALPPTHPTPAPAPTHTTAPPPRPAGGLLPGPGCLPILWQLGLLLLGAAHLGAQAPGGWEWVGAVRGGGEGGGGGGFSSSSAGARWVGGCARVGEGGGIVVSGGGWSASGSRAGRCARNLAPRPLHAHSLPPDPAASPCPLPHRAASPRCLPACRTGTVCWVL